MRILICAATMALLANGALSQEAGENDEQPADTMSEENGLGALPVPEFWFEAYDDTFDSYPFWSGEYPNGFQTGDEPVAVKGRLVMSPASPQGVVCTLPAKANFHTWNIDRVNADALVFWTAGQPTTITVKEDTETWAIVPASGEEVTLNLTAGEELTYKRYLAEGFFVAEYDGQEYEMSEPDLGDAFEFQVATYEDDEWVQVTCEEGFGRRAWLLYRDVIQVEGIEPSPIIGFGEASDPE